MEDLAIDLVVLMKRRKQKGFLTKRGALPISVKLLAITASLPIWFLFAFIPPTYAMDGDNVEAKQGNIEGRLLAKGLNPILAPKRLSTTTPATTTYYIRPSGNDSNDGLSINTAWQTINAINNFDFTRGDAILFEGGQTFSGNIYLDPSDCPQGLPADPIFISSFGSGRAMIQAGSGFGIFIYNCDYVEISNLEIIGADRFNNIESGIFFYTDLPGDVKLKHIYLEQVEVSGFRKAGIEIGAWNHLTGYQDVRITHSTLHHNGGAGIVTWGFFENALVGHPHRDFYVAHNTVYDNPGDPTVTNQHTGNGIVLGNVDGAVIEYNEAFNNGADNGHTGGGPVGIWAWDCNNVTIQFNESHHNQTKTLDGGGFDLDGGCTNSVMQYNYAHDNAGAGYLMAEFAGARPMCDNIIRYNLSLKDGRQGDYGAITLWRQEGIFDGLQVYNNTIYMTGSAAGQPKAFRVMSDHIAGVELYNNIFVTTHGVPVVSLEGGNNQANFTFAGNTYYSSGDTFVINNAGTIYHSLDMWRAETGQETLNGQPVGLNVSPQFVDPMARLDAAAYWLRPDSPLINSGLDLTVLGLAPGLPDSENKALPPALPYDDEAFEHQSPLIKSQVITLTTEGALPGDNGDTLGTYIELQVEQAPAETWSAVQWQDAAGLWHDVEGWRGPLEAGGYRRWWIAPHNFGAGPFRWTLSEGLNSQPWVTSPAFNLPSEATQAVRVEMALD